MSAFKDMVERDNSTVFMNLSEFGEMRTVMFDDEVFQDITIVLIDLEEKDRPQRVNDHIQGLYLVTAVLYCNEADLGGKQPEKGQRIKINDREGGGGFFQEYYVSSSTVEMGMLRVGLREFNE